MREPTESQLDAPSLPISDAYFDSDSAKCFDCSSSRTVGISLLVTLLILVIALFVAWNVSPKMREVIHHHWWRRAALFLHTHAIRTKLKIVVSTYQMTTQFSSVYIIVYPTGYDAIMRKFSWLMAIINPFSALPGVRAACLVPRARAGCPDAPARAGRRGI